MRLWIRADGSPDVGLGHLSRTSALAEEAAARGVDARYVTAGDELGLGFLRRRGLVAEIVDDAWCDRVASGDLVVFDRYGTTESDVRAARERGAIVATLDDFGVPSLPVDVVINPNATIDPASLPAGTRILDGPAHALVRRAFRERRRVRAPAADVLLLSFGGSDPSDTASAVLARLDPARPFKRVLLLEGPGASITSGRPDWLEIVRDPEEPAEVFDRADAAITAAGSTTWELLTMGVPVAVVVVADNQRSVARQATEAGAVMDLDDDAIARLAEPETQRTLTAAGRELVDGRGPQRILDALLSASSA